MVKSNDAHGANARIADDAFLFQSSANTHRLFTAHEHLLAGSYHSVPEADEAVGTDSSHRLAWVDESWQDYCHWRDTDPATFDRLTALLRRVLADPAGANHDDDVVVHKYVASRAWSRKLLDGHRLLYTIEENADHADDETAPVDIVVLQARYHTQ